MPLGRCNFILKWAERRAVTHPLPGPCQAVPSEDSAGAELHQRSEQLLSFAVLLHFYEPPAGVYSHGQDRDLIQPEQKIITSLFLCLNNGKNTSTKVTTHRQSFNTSDKNTN